MIINSRNGTVVEVVVVATSAMVEVVSTIVVVMGATDGVVDAAVAGADEVAGPEAVAPHPLSPTANTASATSDRMASAYRSGGFGSSESLAGDG
jgi:hypothetical protein